MSKARKGGSRSWQSIKQAHSAPIVSVSLSLRGDLVDELEVLEDDLRQARHDDTMLNREPEAPAIALKIQEIEAEARADEAQFKFRGIGRGPFARLMAEHPSTAEQQEAAGDDARLPYDADTFPPALYAASCIEPADLAGNLEAWQEIHDQWSVGQNTKLWRACNAANMGVAETPKSVAASVVLQQNSSDDS